MDIKRSEFLKSKEWKQFRKTIIERDNSTCQLCRCKTKRPKVHHKDQNKQNYQKLNPDNFTTLCHNCHDFVTAMIGRKSLPPYLYTIINPFILI